MERETGFEPATPSLEGWRSTAELFLPDCRTTKTSFIRRARKRTPSARSAPGSPSAGTRVLLVVVPISPAETCAVVPVSRAETRVPLVVAPISAHPRSAPTSKAPATMVGRGGFEPPKAYASRFTVCPLWPLGYLPESAGTHLTTPRKSWRWREDLNPRPTAYKAVALPLSYASTDNRSH